MKKIKLTFFLTVLMSMVGLQAFADFDTSTKVKVDGLYYYLDITNKQAQVTSKPSGYYSGAIEIPPKFYHVGDFYNLTFSVTRIGESAFNGCSGLTSLTIPNSVTSIGGGAFRDCSGLTSVTIPNSVTSIGGGAFSGCSGLTSVKVESGNTKYDSRNDCNAIIETASNTLIAGCKNTVIPNSVTSIGNNAFRECSKLTSVTIPNSVTSIGDGAFYGCSGLTSVTIPNSVTSIGDDAFYNTAWYNNQPDGLVYAGKVAYKYKGMMFSNTTITIGEGTLGIADQAFYNCSGLTSVTIPNSVTSIGYSAFRYCSGLTSVTIGNSVTSISQFAFAGCSGLKKVIVKDIAAWCKISFGGSSANPLYYAKHLYRDEYTEIKDLVIPDGVTSIGDYAFDGCSDLTSVEIPNSVTSIGSWAFDGCTGLTSVTIGNSVTSISENAFNGCSGLTSVTLNSNAIASKTYTSSNNIKNIFGEQVTEYIIGDNVTSIGEYAFYGCSKLTSVTIGKSVTSISGKAFFSCSGLTSVKVESGNTKYDSRNDCNAIIETASNTLIAGCKNTVIPNSVTSIGENAFRGCSGLTSVTIPNSVTSIGNFAFQDCSGLKKVIVKDIAAWCKISFSNNYKANPLYYAKHLYSDENTEIKDLVIPDGVTSIGKYAFEGCSGLTSVTIPNSVTSIGYEAFYGCSGLTSVTIPNSVTSIGNYAFQGCSGLTSVTALNPTPVTIDSYAFTNRKNATLYVPKGSKDAYKAADYWKEFKEIVEIETTGIDQISFQENGNGEQVIDQEGAVWYTIDGKQIDKPKKGINIIRMSDGTTRKVLVK